ncbi:hypothetical protein CLOACE_22390 [Clostridium acetireducens DSM 10703]|jgi:hypothetical protein|uniref:Uncharacterized protein n=1 Tax=Clostridium acetireducens DSM 10703 TaxID=1121290 RepID=A0A1E8EVB9_9CLOT|nr:hypothetical protein [Clostridium acetireducens]OFH99449.1 hypothetical protein CLOACE_22390 [Clostridium acetireducens DSM 10703]
MSLVKSVDSIIKLKDLINEGKWVRNDIGMFRIQYGKLLNVKEKLKLIIVSNSLEEPIYTSVEKILISGNDEAILFYDGQYPIRLHRNDYKEYDKYIDKSEWELLFGEDAGTRLERKDLVNKKEGFYVQPHINLENCMMSDYDEEETERVNRYFNL